MRASGWLVGAASLLAGADRPRRRTRAGGVRSLAALGALWSGAFGSWYALTSATLVRAVPLILIGSGSRSPSAAAPSTSAPRASSTPGAIAATWIGLGVGLSLSARSGGGALGRGARRHALGGDSGAAPRALRRARGDQHAAAQLRGRALTSLLVQGPLQESQRIYPQSDPIAESARLPLLPDAPPRGDSRWRSAARCCCTGSSAARSGDSGPRRRAGPARGGDRRPDRQPLDDGARPGLSGAIAGLAGGVEVAGVSYALFQNLSPGYGFTAIAVALLARLAPVGCRRRGPALRRARGRRGRDAARGRGAGRGVYVVEAVVILAVLLADCPPARRRDEVARSVPAGL